MLVSSDRVDFGDLERARWRLRRESDRYEDDDHDGDRDDNDDHDDDHDGDDDGAGRFTGTLTNLGNGTFKASFRLSQLPGSSGCGDSPSGDAMVGRELFLRNRCGLCHGSDGSGPEDIRCEDANEIRKVAGRGDDHPGGAFPLLTRKDFKNIAAYLAVGGSASWTWSARIEDSRGRTFTPHATISLSGAIQSVPDSTGDTVNGREGFDDPARTRPSIGLELGRCP
jgi:hypothetical protein